MRAAAATLWVVAFWGCHRAEDEAGHGHAHGPHGEHVEAGEPEPFAVTRWTQTHELFVEFEPPVIGKPVKYHAHVTRLADNHAATEGVFEVDWLQGEDPAASFAALEVARAGIFAFSAAAPETAGTYRLRFTYRNGDEEAVWDGGTHALGAEAPPPPETAEGEISFLKEAQWKIAFAAEPPQPRPLARPLKLSGTVQPAPGRIKAVTAPAAGRLEWVAPVGVGARIQAGAPLGRLIPAAVADHWSTLRLRVRETDVERRRLEVEVARLAALARDGLVPGSQLDQARAELAQVRARLDAARQQQDSVGGEAVALPVVAPVDGVVIEAPLADGTSISAGDILIRLAQDGATQVVAEVLPAEVPDLTAIQGAWVEAAGAPPVAVALRTQGALVVDPRTGLAPIVFEGLPTWPLGAHVPLHLEVGSRAEVLSVPREAVVEINTKPFVFVMLGGESFTRRAVVVGGGNAAYVGIVSGVGPTDRVVTRGAFDVHVASLSGGLESHRH